MALNVKVGEEVALGSNVAQQIVVTDAVTGNDVNHIVRMINGTPQLGIGGVGANQYANPVDSVVIFFCKNGNLWVKGEETDKIVVWISA